MTKAAASKACVQGGRSLLALKNDILHFNMWMQNEPFWYPPFYLLHILQALFWGDFPMGFLACCAIGKVVFIHAPTNATDNHKYSLFPSQILSVTKLGYHWSHSFSRKMTHLTLTGVLRGWGRPLKAKRAIYPPKWCLQKYTKTPGTQSCWIFVISCGNQSVGGSQRKGEHLPFGQKNGVHKN